MEHQAQQYQQQIYVLMEQHQVQYHEVDHGHGLVHDYIDEQQVELAQ
jgi:hypothetical protein